MDADPEEIVEALKPAIRADLRIDRLDYLWREGEISAVRYRTKRVSQSRYKRQVIREALDAGVEFSDLPRTAQLLLKSSAIPRIRAGDKTVTRRVEAR